MTATKESPTITRLGKTKQSPAYFVFGIATRLQSPEVSFIHDTLSFLDSGSQSYSDPLKDFYCNLDRGVAISNVGSNYVVAGTNPTNDLNSYLALRPDLFCTTLLNRHEEPDFFDFVFKPKYTKEFRLKVKSVRINKSLPKISAD